MKTQIHTLGLLSLLLVSCSSDKNESQSLTTEKGPRKLRLVDLGTKTFSIDYEADFTNLEGLQLKEFDAREYMSFNDWSKQIIYQYDYETGELVNKIRIAKDGPNRVPVQFTFQYFFHSMDSIFINPSFNGYYLINDKAELINKIAAGSDESLSVSARNTLSFDAASYFSDNIIYGAQNISLLNDTEDLMYARTYLDFDDNQVKRGSLSPRSFIGNFDEIMEVRKELKKGVRFLFTMRRQYARHDDYLYASTPISDSVMVFKGDSLVKTLTTKMDGFELAKYKEFITIRKMVSKPGEVSATTESNQPSFYTDMFIDPKGEYIYRIFSHGTRPSLHPVTGKEVPEITGATLLVIKTDTGEVYQMELPVDEIELKTLFNKGIFVSNRGIHFRVREQENEDEVQFRVFGVAQKELTEDDSVTQ